MKRIILIIPIIICHFLTHAQTSPQIDTLYRNSYTVFELERLPNGMYRDSKLFTGTDYHPISIANTGMGLISLCIADSNGWINNAEELALATLKNCNRKYCRFYTRQNIKWLLSSFYGHQYRCSSLEF